jgi:hypothetical protein
VLPDARGRGAQLLPVARRHAGQKHAFRDGHACRATETRGTPSVKCSSGHWGQAQAGEAMHYWMASQHEGQAGQAGQAGRHAPCVNAPATHLPC